MHLTHLATSSGRQVLRGVFLAPCAVAAGVATDPRTRAEAAADQGGILAQDAFDVALVLLGGLTQALTETARAFAHEQRISYCWHICQIN